MKITITKPMNNAAFTAFFKTTKRMEARIIVTMMIINNFNILTCPFAPAKA